MCKRLSMPREELAQFIKKWAGKKTAHAIAQETEVSYASVHRVAQEIGVSLVVKGVQEKKKRVYDYVLENHAKYTAQQIGRKLKVNPSTVYTVAYNLKVKLKSNKVSNPVKKLDSNLFFNEMARENWLL